MNDIPEIELEEMEWEEIEIAERDWQYFRWWKFKRWILSATKTIVSRFGEFGEWTFKILAFATTVGIVIERSTTGGRVAYFILWVYILASFVSVMFRFKDWFNGRVINSPGRIYTVKSQNKDASRRILEFPNSRIKFEGNLTPIWVHGAIWFILIGFGIIFFLVTHDIINIWFEMISDMISGASRPNGGL